MPRRLGRAPAPARGGDRRLVGAVEQVQHAVEGSQPRALGAVQQEQEARAVRRPPPPSSVVSQIGCIRAWPLAWCRAAASPGRCTATARRPAPPPAPAEPSTSARPPPASTRPSSLRQRLVKRRAGQVVEGDIGHGARLNPGPGLRNRARPAHPAAVRRSRSAPAAPAAPPPPGWRRRRCRDAPKACRQRIRAGRRRRGRHPAAARRSRIASGRQSRCRGRRGAPAPIGIGQSGSPTTSPAAAAWASSAASVPNSPARWAPSAVTTDAGQGREIQHRLRPEAAGVVQRIGQHQAALGIGIDHLDRRARAHAQHVAGAVGGAADGCSRPAPGPPRPAPATAAGPAPASPRRRRRRPPCRPASPPCRRPA